jgi:hypothetical protein
VKLSEQLRALEKEYEERWNNGAEEIKSAVFAYEKAAELAEAEESQKRYRVFNRRGDGELSFATFGEALAAWMSDPVELLIATLGLTRAEGIAVAGVYELYRQAFEPGQHAHDLAEVGYGCLNFPAKKLSRTNELHEQQEREIGSSTLAFDDSHRDNPVRSQVSECPRCVVGIVTTEPNGKQWCSTCVGTP